MRAEYRLVDFTQESLALTQALAELQIGNRVPTQQACHVVYNAEGLFSEELYCRWVGLRHKDLHNSLNRWQSVNKDLA